MVQAQNEFSLNSASIQRNDDGTWQVGDFIVHERLGRGSFAVVYRARQRFVDREVALKVIELAPDADEAEAFERRFASEASLIASLEHFHIVPVYSFGVYDHELAYLAMRYMRGGTLANLLRQGAPTIERTADLFMQIGLGLHHAHTRGVIHRDLKPGNVLLDETGNAYLSDFGLARLVGTGVEMTRQDILLGTPVYSSPEHFQNGVVDHRSDVYSLGVMLYHMLCGRPPFLSTNGTILPLIYQHGYESPPSLRALNSAVSPKVEAVVMQALAKRPEDRFQRAHDFVFAFNEALGRDTPSSAHVITQVQGVRGSRVDGRQPKRLLPFLNRVLPAQDSQIQDDRYQALVAGIADWVWVTNPQGEALHFPVPWEGINDETGRGWSWINFLHPDDRERTAQIWLQAVQEKRPYATEYRMRALDGTYRHFQVKGIPVFEKDGSIREWIGMNVDVTESKRREREVTIANERLRLAAESANGIVYDIDLKTGFAERPHGLFDQLGYTPHDDLSWDWWQKLVHPDDAEGAKNAIAEALKRDERYAIEYRLRHKNGHYVYFWDQATIIRDEEGRPIRTVGINLNVDAQKQIEARLRESENLNRRISEAMPGVLYVYDIQQKQNTYINRQFEIMLGYTQQQMTVVGTTIMSKLMHPDDYVRHPERIPRVLKAADGEVVDFEYRVRHANGEWRWIRSHDVVFTRDEAGVPTQLLGFAIDITAQKEAEARLAERNAFIERIATATPGIAYIFDLNEGSNHFVNDEAIQFLGYTAVELAAMGSNLLPTIMHPDDIAALAPHLERVRRASDGEIVAWDYRMRNRAGEWHWFNANHVVFERNVEGVPYRMLGVAVDIQSRKDVEQQLAERSAFIERVTATTPAIIGVLDLHTFSAVYANREIKTMLGYTAEAIQEMGEGLLPTLMHPDDLPSMMAHLHQMQTAGNEVREIEYRVRTAQGNYRWLRNYDTVFQRDEAGTPTQMLVVSLDITAQKEAEAQLVEEQYFMQQIAANTPSLIYIHDISTDRHIYSNNAIELIFGYTSEQVRAMGDNAVMQLVYPEDVPNVYKAFDAIRHAHDGEIVEYEFRARHANGELRSVYNRIAVFRRDAEGNVTQVLGVGVDVTTQKDAEAQLAERNRFIEEVTQALPGIVYIFDLISLNTVYASPEMERFLGYSAARIRDMGANLTADIMHPDDLVYFGEYLEKIRCAQAEDRLEFDYRMRGADGQWHWFHTHDTIFQRDEQGNPTQILGVALDITEQKQAVGTLEP